MNYIYLISLVFCIDTAVGNKSNNKLKYENSKSHSKESFTPPSVPVKISKTTVETETCPDGYWYERGRCTSKSKINTQMECPPNAMELHGVCYDVSVPRYQCPPNSVPSDNFCTLTESIEAMMYTPSPFELKGERGVMATVDPTTCPLDSYLEGNFCVFEQPVGVSCPPGTEPAGGVCVEIVIARPTLVCPEPFSLVGSSCQLKVTFDQVCPEGTSVSGDRCLKLTTPLQVCPSEYEDVWGVCRKEVVAPKLISCPNGGDPNNDCVARVEVPLTPYCNEPAKLVDGECQLIKTETASMSCPSGYEVVGMRCEKSMEYDCSVSNHEVECDDVAVPAKTRGISRGLQNMYSSHGAKHSAKLKYSTSPPKEESPLPVCRKNVQVIPKTCTYTAKADGEPFCVSGKYKGGMVCEVLELSTPLSKCSGISDSNSCFIEARSSVVRTCPSGYKALSLTECGGFEIVPPVFECAPLTVQGPGLLCSIEVPKVCPIGGCDRTITESAQATYPPGYTTGVSEGVKQTFVAPVYVCPTGTEREGLSCVKRVSVQVNEKEQDIPATLLCPDSYTLYGEECVRTTLFQATPVCPDETILEAGGCLKPLAKQSTCPKGSVLEKGECWVFESSEPLKVDTVVQTPESPPRVPTVIETVPSQPKLQARPTVLAPPAVWISHRSYH